MDTVESLQQRLADLELKVADNDDLLDQMNLALYRQQQHIDRLTRELALLRQQMPEPGSGAPRSLRDEIPPHY
ncbi:MAG: SlyX protein [Burkholderiales bacterium 68-12]|uniref:SlyX family protein n=1 Tax=Comamonas granuli TaxID=290309 RepID=UPI0005A70875|nr:SlyX family protein [Comamonas granuli]MCZ2406718.1 SlyX family protein [Burkholderiales bacterium]OJX36421.1 MAG: SlyX protein [Burkholderiales bacterium 68-12]